GPDAIRGRHEDEANASEPGRSGSVDRKTSRCRSERQVNRKIMQPIELRIAVVLAACDSPYSYGYIDTKWYGSNRFRQGMRYFWKFTNNGWRFISRSRSADSTQTLKPTEWRNSSHEPRHVRLPSTYG